VSKIKYTYIGTLETATAECERLLERNDALERELALRQPVSRTYPCGCITCICEPNEENRCNDCGAKMCGKPDAECDLKQRVIREALRQPSADFEPWLRSVCFQQPTPEAYDLAKCAWVEASKVRQPSADVAGSNVCPDCKCTFLQPFVCVTCGAQKLYDATLRTAEQRAEKAELTLDALSAKCEALERELEFERKLAMQA
jgi:hypothetical protein